MTRWPGRLLVVLLAALAALMVAGPASAHLGGAPAAGDFDGRVLSVRPALPGVTVRVLSFGDDVELTNRGDTEVLVTGYSDEPYLRIGPRGVFRNASSPATYINADRYGRVALPPGASASTPPRWVKVSAQPQFVWLDHRTHWMSPGLLPPSVAADPTHSHVVFRWTIPVLAGGTKSTVSGELTWTPPPSPWLVWPVYLVLFLLPVAAGFARTSRPLATAVVVGAAAALWHVFATPGPPAGQGSPVGALLSALLPAVGVLVLAGLGLWAAVRGRDGMTGLAAVAAGLLMLFEGVPDAAAMWSAHVLASGPQLLARAAVAVLVAGGAGCLVGGIAAIVRFRDRPDTDLELEAETASDSLAAG